mmetsp:Transcript_24823/g.69706  ORF Transcript_24823/g.69706 Transcript_24823/m.69706 type:complete len:99 (+) Transcript_24823:347-643(+)
MAMMIDPLSVKFDRRRDGGTTNAHPDMPSAIMNQPAVGTLEGRESGHCVMFAPLASCHEGTAEDSTHDAVWRSRGAKIERRHLVDTNCCWAKKKKRGD